MLARRLGQDRVAAEPQAVDDLIALCARLPLALAIAAARAITHPRLTLAALAGELRDARDRLSTLDTGDTVTDVRAVFSWSYQRLGTEPARLFRLLGLHPGPDISTQAAASLVAIPVEHVRPLLSELGRVHLITQHVPGRYTLHDLLRLYAADQAQAHNSDDERLAASHRMLDHYLHSALTADRLLYPSRDLIDVAPPLAGTTPEAITGHDQALDWFATERMTLIAAIEHSRGTDFETQCWQLAWALPNFLERRGHWQDWITTQTIALDAARRLRDRSMRAIASRSLGRAYIHLSQYDTAHRYLRRALILADQLGDKVNHAHAHVNLAEMFGHQDRFSAALDHIRQALDLYRAAGHRLGQANALNGMGWYQALLGNHSAALVHCEQALALHQTIGHRHGQAVTLHSLGYAHHHLGQYRQAESCYQRALDIARDLGNRYSQARILGHLGDTHQAGGNAAAARDIWRQALDIFSQLAHPDADVVRAKLQPSKD